MPTFVQTINPTPFGFFDADPIFQKEADGMVTFVKRSLGDDVLSVELTKKQIWSCFEEAVLDFGLLINEMRITSELINVLGLPTGSTDLTNLYPRPTLEYLLRLADAYATESFVGGSYDATLGYFNTVPGQQDYDIYADLFNAETNTNMYLSQASGSRGKIRIIDVFHFEPIAAQSFLLNASNVTNFLASNFNYESYVNSSVFYVLPVFEDVLRRSMLETAMRVRRSNYSYSIIGSKLRVYPMPSTDYDTGRLFVKVYNGSMNPISSSIGGVYGDTSVYGVSSPSNAPYGNIPYGSITGVGRQWIRQMTLALCKELLGLVRSKFSTIPIPNADLTLNGESLVSQGREDRDKLRDQLREWLSGLTNQALVTAQADLAEALQRQLKLVPMPAGKCIVIG